MATPPKLFVQFAGQGMQYIDELRRLYTSTPSIRPFVDRAAAAIAAQRATDDDTVGPFYDQGLDVGRWLADGPSTPGFGYLSSSPISHCLIYLTQMANYLAFLDDVGGQDRLLPFVHGTTGFSTGVMAALVAALPFGREDLWTRALAVQSMFFWQGARCQESMIRHDARPVLDEQRSATAEGCPSAMASVADVPRSKLDALIAEFAPQGTVYLAYKLSPLRCIVAGHPDTLERFRAFLGSRLPKPSWRWVVSTIAAHSPLLDHAYATTPADARRVGLAFAGSELARPVLSNDGGKDLRESPDIVDDVMRAYFLETGYWREQLAPLFAGEGITHVLDFGPGAGVAGLTEMHLTRLDVKVVRCAVPLERTMFIEKVLRPALS